MQPAPRSVHKPSLLALLPIVLGCPGAAQEPETRRKSSRVRRADHARLIPLTEPYVRASYTAHAHSILIFEAVAVRT
ncbi:MAG: hypothetical protein EHM79_13010, partial [Geobacter sp.]